VLAAPIVAGVYYLSIKAAFAQSIVSVLGRGDLFDVGTPRWGSHWIYRAAAEVFAKGFGTFVAAGLSLGRERVAAILGGSAVSLGFVAKLVVIFIVWKYANDETSVIWEPWYQYAIDVGMIVAAPVIGSFVAEAAEDMHRDAPSGFGGVNRLHLLWLWLAAYCYAIGLIGPMARLYVLHDVDVFSTFTALFVNAIPAVVMAIPGYYGIAFLAGHHGDTMHPAGRNFVGALVLIFGFFVGLLIQEAWYWIIQRIWGAISG